jgi:hypothetical protein
MAGIAENSVMKPGCLPISPELQIVLALKALECQFEIFLAIIASLIRVPRR